MLTTLVEQLIEVTRNCGVINTFEGQLLGQRVADLVNIVLDRTARVVPADECPGVNPPTPDD